MAQTFAFLNSPIGRLLIVAGDGGLTSIRFPPQGGVRHAVDGAWTEGGPLVAEAARQLDEYFAGRRRVFELPLAPGGTPFMRAVWAELGRIPYGQTTSYGALAARLGKPGSSRAVGSANGKNPLPIVVPCHRVIGADGSLTGFAGGLAIKRALLDLEGLFGACPEPVSG